MTSTSRTARCGPACRVVWQGSDPKGRPLCRSDILHAGIAIDPHREFVFGNTWEWLLAVLMMPTIARDPAFSGFVVMSGKCAQTGPGHSVSQCPLIGQSRSSVDAPPLQFLAHFGSRTCQKPDLHETMPSNSKHIVTSFCRVSADARS
jgi:hypothetical protein